MPSSQSPSAESVPLEAELNGHHAEGDAMRRRFVEAARRAEIVTLINAATSERELGLRFCEELCEVFDAEFAFVIDDGGESGASRVVGSVGMRGTDADAIFERPECKQVVESGRAISLEGPDCLGIGAAGAVLAPFRTDDGRVALVGLARLHDLPFYETDRSLVEAVTLAVGQGLERIWAYEARDRSAGQQSALVSAAKSMSRSLEIEAVLQTLCEEVKRGIQCDTAAACLGDEVDGYVAIGAAGLDGFVGFRQSPGTGLGGRAVRAGRLLVTHAYKEEHYSPPETTALKDIRSSVAVPLRWDGRTRGFLSAGYTSPRRIAVSEVELVEGFAELAGLACANAERHAAVVEAAELDALTGCLNRNAFEERLIEMIAKAGRAGSPLSLALLDLDGFKSINDVFGHLSGDAVLRKVGSALRSGMRAGDVAARYGGDEFALILPDAGETEAAPVLDRVRAAIRSMEVPGGKLTACVGVAEWTEAESLTELLARADEALREAKSSPGPGSIRRASRSVTMASVRASRPAPDDHDRRQLWRAGAGDIGLWINRQPDHGASSAVAAQELRDLLGLGSCAVLRLVSEGRLEEVATSGAGELAADWLGADHGVVGRSLREKRAILGEHGAASRRDPELSSGSSRSAMELAVPLIIAGRAWGAIACRAGERELDEVDAELVAAVADHLSAAIRTDDLYEQLTDSMIGTAEALAAAMAAKDSYTADHASRIAELAVEVGRRLDLPESAIDDLRYGGIFHDIGKIAVPDAIINKPGPLTDAEFELIKEHPAAGADILAPVPFLYGVRTIVRHAHEHWDGGGYPDGLAGKQIPLGARIVLAVDAYHAMTSDRPYRARMSEEAARKELCDNAGTQFDPEVIEALLAVLGDR